MYIIANSQGKLIVILLLFIGPQVLLRTCDDGIILLSSYNIVDILRKSQRPLMSILLIAQRCIERSKRLGWLIALVNLSCLTHFGPLDDERTAVFVTILNISRRATIAPASVFLWRI